MSYRTLKPHRRRWGRAVLFLVAGSATLLMVGIAFIAATEIPNASSLKDRKITESTKIYDRTGEIVLYELYGEEKRTIIPFNDIPRDIKNATIAIEDAAFYSHFGIRPLSLVRVVFLNTLRGKPIGSGGSTITQQLIKNTLLTPERTLTRKIKEVALAIKIETIHSKDEILALYLNQIPYGANAYGVEAAAQTFFGKHASDLTLAESTYLAALPKAPSYFSPYGNHRDDLEARKNLVLERMRELGFVDEKRYLEARNEAVIFLPSENRGIRAPHFVMYILDQLTEEFGEDVVRSSGMKVITSLDARLQAAAEEVVVAHAQVIEKNYNARNSSLIAIDPQTGEILAMVGSRNYFDIEHDGNFNITLAHRQPGSAFKPIVYAAAFAKGYTPETVIFDAETEFASEGADSYKPQNYDNVFRGPVSLRAALAQSINVPAVKVLYLVGLKDAVSFAKDLGIGTLTEPSRYGLSLVLGGGEVRLLDLAGAYGAFANDGVHNTPHGLLKVENGTGSTLTEYTPEPKQVMDTEVARMISDILSDNDARAPAFGQTSALHFPDKHIAVKTGTTNDYRDAWIIGYTPNIVAGVWAGNNDNTPMEKRVAGFIVAPIWHDFMERALTVVLARDFTRPQQKTAEKPALRGIWKGGAIYKIDTVSGNLATDQTPPEFIEERVVENIHTILYWVDKKDPLGAPPENPTRDPQFKNWEHGVHSWLTTHGGAPTSSPIPTDYDLVHTETNKPRITLRHPKENEEHLRTRPLTIEISIEGSYPIKQIDYFLDGVLTGSKKENISTITIPPSFLETASRELVITVRAYDNVGNTNEKQTTIILSSA